MYFEILQTKTMKVSRKNLFYMNIKPLIGLIKFITIAFGIIVSPALFMFYVQPQFECLQRCNEIDGVIQCENLIKYDEIKSYEFLFISFPFYVALIFYLCLHQTLLISTMDNITNDELARKLNGYTLYSETLSFISLLLIAYFCSFTTTNVIIFICSAIILPYMFNAILMLFLVKFDDELLEDKPKVE